MARGRRRTARSDVTSLDCPTVGAGEGRLESFEQRAEEQSQAIVLADRGRVSSSTGWAQAHDLRVYFAFWIPDRTI